MSKQIVPFVACLLMAALMMFASFPYVQADGCSKDGEACNSASDPCCDGYKCVLGGRALRLGPLFINSWDGCVKCNGLGRGCGHGFTDTRCCDSYQCDVDTCV